MSDECGVMNEFAVKVEPPDTGSLDSGNTVKMEPADVDDVFSLDEETVVKEEIDIEPTVIRPPDFVYKQLHCKHEPVEDTPAGTSYSVKRQDDSASGKSYSTLSDQVDARKASVDCNDSRPHRCETCNKYFKYSSSQLIITHTVERPYHCEACNKCFTSTSNLKVHSTTHTGDRPYNCEVCNKCFTQSSHLISHMKTHTGERLYSCEVCNKCFKRNGDLAVHSRSHTGDRPFNCEVCDKCFTTSYKLKTHARTHTGERPYNCEVCDKCFKTSSNLKAHSRTHM